MKTITQLVQQLKNTFSDRKNIAPVESSSTASQAYAVGKKFFYNNILYKCTVAIASGGTITPGTNCVAESDVETQIDNAVAETSSLKETLTNQINVMGAKNLLQHPYTTKVPNTIANLDVTEPSKGIIRFNGTSNAQTIFYCQFRTTIPTGEYICSKGVQNNNVTLLVEAYNNNTWVKVLSSESYTVAESKFTVDYSNYNNLRISIRIKSGVTLSNVDVKPMIRLATDPDSTYEPYAATNQQLTGLISNDFANGAVNLCPTIITSQTVDTGGTNVTIVVNSDGTFTVNGTVTNSTNINVTDVLVNFLKAGKRYKLSGSPSGSSNSTYRLYISATGGEADNGNGYEFTLEQLANGARVRLALFAGAILSNVVFKPMITLADMPNSDYNHYVPYAMSNKEITDNNKYVELSTLGIVSSSPYFDYSNTTMKGYINRFTKNIIVEFNNIVTKTAVPANTWVAIGVTEDSFYKAFVAMSNVADVTKDGQYYLALFAKNSSDGTLIFKAQEAIPVGATINAKLTWNYVG